MTNTDFLSHTRPIALFGEVLFDVFPDKRLLGGAPYNVARHLKGFNQFPTLLSRIGQDEMGDEVLDTMHAQGMDTSGIEFDMHYPTGQVEITLADGHHQFHIVPNQAYDHMSALLIDEFLEEAQPSLVYFGTLALRSLASRLAAETLLTRCDCPVFLDLNIRMPWFNREVLTFALNHANIVKLNEDEFAQIANMLNVQGSSAEISADFIRTYALDKLIVTCGAKGAWQMQHDFSIVTSYPEADVLHHENSAMLADTVGAGDAFAAVCLLGDLLGWPAQTSLDRANQFAAAICQIRGATPQDSAFYHPFMQQWLH